jgi:hypothetical protein
MEGYGMELPIEMASEVAADKSGSNIMADFFDCDNALDSSSILNNLPGDTSVLFPFTSAQPDVEDSSLESLDLAGLGLLHLSPLPCRQQLEVQDKPTTDSSGIATGDPTHSNTETTSYQELVAKEDELVDAIRRMILVSTDPNIENLLAPHISPRIRDQISLSSPTSASLSPRPSTEPSPQPKISLASVELPDVDENTAPRWAKLGVFIPQKKERRKESYGIR